MKHLVLDCNMPQRLILRPGHTLCLAQERCRVPHTVCLVRMPLQQIRELATFNTTFFPISHERLDLLRHALDVEAEVVVDVLAR